MSETRYDILFGGELLPGFAPDAVAENLAKLFKATPETVHKLMGGGTHSLKRNTDRETALKYQAAMQKAGAMAILREVKAEAEAGLTAVASIPAAPQPPAAAPPVRAAPSAAPAASAPASALSLAPQSGNLLADSERSVPAAVQVDTSHIKLASTFMAPEEPQRAPAPAAPDTSHITIAAAGADLLPDKPADTAPPPPDTSAITLAAPGATLGSEEAPLEMALPDISAITLAPPGAPLDELRPERKPLNPDTSALKLEPVRAEFKV